MNHRFTWKKEEKLKSRTRIERVFKEGKSFAVFPFRVYFLFDPPGGSDVVAGGARVIAGGPGVGVQAGFGASRRNFKKAVDRNRIKRLSREAYRLQKGELVRRVKDKGKSMALFFIFTGKELPEYTIVAEKIAVALQKLLKETA